MAQNIEYRGHATVSRGVCRHDGHTISSHIQVPRRPEIGDCPGFDGITRDKYASRPMTATEQELSDELADSGFDYRMDNMRGVD